MKLAVCLCVLGVCCCTISVDVVEVYCDLLHFLFCWNCSFACWSPLTIHVISVPRRHVLPRLACLTEMLGGLFIACMYKYGKGLKISSCCVRAVFFTWAFLLDLQRKLLYKVQWEFNNFLWTFKTTWLSLGPLTRSHPVI